MTILWLEGLFLTFLNNKNYYLVDNLGLVFFSFSHIEIITVYDKKRGFQNALEEK